MSYLRKKGRILFQQKKYNRLQNRTAKLDENFTRSNDSYDTFKKKILKPVPKRVTHIKFKLL